jgi:hypothetical protein
MGSCSDACPIHDARQDRPGIVALRLKNFDHPRKRATGTERLSSFRFGFSPDVIVR